MATSSPSQDVTDPEYTNWLKVGLALLCMKKSLHSFIENEINLMHTILVQKIYKGSPVSQPKCTQCTANKIIHTRGATHSWRLNTPKCSSLCHDWFTELLSLQNSPLSDKIYWSNCDVASWPTNPWEVAKAFMPRGQIPTNSSPEFCDAQALLTLLENCKHFHQKLSPQGRNHTRMVCKVRNDTVHVANSRLTDIEMRKSIQEIIDFLEDHTHLQSLNECREAVTKIKKIRDDSLYVVFNFELEMKVLRELRGEPIEKLGKDMEAVHRVLGSHTRELMDVHQVLDSQTSDLHNIHTFLECHTSNLCNLQEALHHHTSDFQDVQQVLGSHSRSIQEVHQVLSSHSDDLVRLRDEVGNIKKQTSSIDERGTITLNTSTITESELRNLQLLLISAYRSVGTIPVSPVFETKLKDLEDLYTYVDIKEESGESAQRQNLVSPQKMAEITSFKQIFKKSNSGGIHILLKSPAGLGKSTFCRKIVHTWCSIQKVSLGLVSDAELSDTMQGNGLKDEDEMLQFDILLYVSLREISDEQCLMDVIYRQFPFLELKDHTIRSHLIALMEQAEDNRVLLIIDGLDELNSSTSFIEKVMKRRLYPTMTVLATTRPWKIGHLQLSQPAHIDLLLDLQGFNSHNSILFAAKILEKFYGDTSSICRFQSDVKKNHLIETLIHIPLLLLFIIHVWYKSKSFPQTIHKLYLKMLNTMVDRYMENMERRQREKGTQNEDFVGLSSRWPLEDTTFAMVPRVKSLRLVDLFGEEFLVTICEVANHFLFISHRENSLVFKENSLVKLLGTDGRLKLQAAIDIGLFSTTDSPAVLKKGTTLSFLHKTIQEFLTAINLCIKEDRLATFLASFKTINDVLQNENIIIFVSGISPFKFDKIFEKIYEVYDVDNGMQEHQEEALREGFSNNAINSLCRLYESCARESSRSLNAVGVQKWNVLHSYLKSTADVKLVCLYDINFTPEQCQAGLSISLYSYLSYVRLERITVDDVSLDFSDFKCLTWLFLKDVTMRNTNSLVLSKCPQLKFLRFESVCLNSATLDLSGCTCLTEVNIYSVNVTDTSKLMLSQCPKLKCLKLDDVDLNIAILDLSGSTSLIEVTVLSMTSTGRLVLSQCPKLKRLKLKDVKVKEAILNLSLSTSLTEVTILCMTGRGSLVISQCQHLSYLKLEDVELNEVILDLSWSTGLTDVNIQYDVTHKSTVLLSQCSQLRYLMLKNGRMSDKLDFSETSSLTEVNQVDVTIRNHLVISQCPQLESLLLHEVDDAIIDLSRSTCLTELNLYNVTVAGKGELVLSQCTQLRSLSLQRVSLNDAILDLSSCTCLTWLHISKLTKSGKSELVLTPSTQLKHLSLREVCIDDAMLDLSRSTCLTELSLYKVVMSGKSKIVLAKCMQLTDLTLQQVTLESIIFDLLGSTCLRKLTLFDVKTHECKLNFPDLSESTFLQDLTFGNVNMCNDSKMKICHNLSQCKELISLSLHSLDLEDILLSLDSLHRLTKLNLDSVILCNNSKEKLCNSLSYCVQLETLSLKKLDLGYSLLSLENSLDKLTWIILDKVTICNHSKVKLCNCLSRCTQLYYLSLANLELGDALLCLENLHRLTILSLDNVTLCNDSMVKLCNSLPQCKKLLKLQLCNLDLGDALLTMNTLNAVNNTSYESSLKLENVTVSSHSADHMLTSLHHLDLPINYLLHMYLWMKPSDDFEKKVLTIQFNMLQIDLLNKDDDDEEEEEDDNDIEEEDNDDEEEEEDDSDSDNIGDDSDNNDNELCVLSDIEEVAEKEEDDNDNNDNDKEDAVHIGDDKYYKDLVQHVFIDDEEEEEADDDDDIIGDDNYYNDHVLFETEAADVYFCTINSNTDLMTKQYGHNFYHRISPGKLVGVIRQSILL